MAGYKEKKDNSVLKEKEKLFGEMLDITRKQSQVLNDAGQEKEEVIRKFDGLIDIRQEVIDKIKELEDSDEIDVDTVEAVQVQKNIDDIIERIQQIDSENNAMAKEILEQLKEHMKSLQKGKQTFGSYIKKPRQVEGFFVDNKK